MKTNDLALILNTKYQVLLLLILAAFLRFLFLNHHQIWFDEAFSYLVAKQDISSLLLAIVADNHPPFYFLVLHFWMLMFGSNETTLRLLSLLIGIGAIYVCFLLAKNLFNKKIAVYSATFFALSPLMIYYSIEVRMHILFVLLTLLATLFWIKSTRSLGIINPIFFIIFFTLNLYTHYFALLLIFPFLYLGIKQKSIRLLLLVVISFMFYTPWLKWYFDYSHPASITVNSLLALPATFASFVLGGTGIITLREYLETSTPIYAKLLFLITVSLAMVVFIKGVYKSLKKEEMLILSILFIPLGILIILNTYIPLFSVRSTVFLAPFFYILLALGLDSLAKKYKVPILVLFCFLFSLTSIALIITPNLKPPDLKQVPADVNRGKILHSSILTFYPFLYYSPKLENYLITRNPLNDTTINIIGGKSLEKIAFEEFILVDIKNGADLRELEKLKEEINTKYRIKEIKKGTITLYNYQKL